MSCTTLGRKRHLRRIGLQIYSVRDDARKDLERTLAAIAAIGYKDVELLASWKNFNTPARTVRGMLDRTGLRAPSTHIDALALDDLERNLDDAQILGHEALIVASIPEERRKTLDDYRYWADRFNHAGAIAQKRGVWIGFHNHAFDVQPVDGYDLLLERTEPGAVRFQLDTSNLLAAGKDPMAYLKQFGSRYWSFHLKDEPEIGAGTIDFSRLLGSIDRIDEKLLYVEQENSPSPLDSVRRDYAAITTVAF